MNPSSLDDGTAEAVAADDSNSKVAKVVPLVPPIDERSAQPAADHDATEEVRTAEPRREAMTVCWRMLSKITTIMRLLLGRGRVFSLKSWSIKEK